MQIITRQEAKEKGLSRYFTGKPCTKGHIAERRVANHSCAVCSNEQSKQYQKIKRESTDLTATGNPKHEQPAREAARKAAIEKGEKTYFHGIPCKRGHFAPRQTSNGYCMECLRLKNADPKIIAYKQKHKRDNRQRYTELNKAYKKKWNKENPYYFTEYFIKRTRKLAQATPEWVDMAEIHRIHKYREKISRKTGVEYHVDHYYPLQGKNICGLNVPWNLQVITAEENMAKHNKMPEEFYGANHTMSQPPALAKYQTR
jgi:hypothetical protein